MKENLNSFMENTEEEIIVLKARKPSLREEFYLSWGIELVKNQLNFINELLKLQVAICIGILAASFIFEEIFEGNPFFRNIALVCFCLSLLSAFVGILPYSRQGVNLDCPEEIEDYTNDAIRYKENCYMIAGVSIIVGIFVIVLTTILK